jgi:GR25 family glycosyltransferase involved in LPS biosynthesis
MINQIDHIFYINLDHRTDRKQEMERELDDFGLSYERFPAFYNQQNGGVGCGYSHIEALKIAKAREYKSVLILEDDFTFLVSKNQFEQGLRELAKIEYDVCMISYNLHESKETDNPIFKKVIKAGTTSGYIVRSHYYDKLIDIWNCAIPEYLTTGMHWIYAIDVVWYRLQEQDSWFCFEPRMGKQRPSYSDCGKCFADHGV